MGVFSGLLPQSAFVSLLMAEVRIKFAPVRVKFTGVRVKFAGDSKNLLRAGSLSAIKSRNQTKARACLSTILLLLMIVLAGETTTVIDSVVGPYPLQDQSRVLISFFDLYVRLTLNVRQKLW
jgi:hypothetical protein